ncbi:lytic transglycosylase domain-containing protein [uncultured Rhodoblastus sp.]|uniref:lytic transglycosylase domain-containing protein n=1 Tax=uncultured Rhodoblastus sp. TaxID=543037 RepID=UPI0025FF8B6C|nr:lytic transglycosylase domain-containing protein [uncultured Rhodoblastus sp.]
MHTATRHAAAHPLVSSCQIFDRSRARPTAIATAIIAMMGMPGNTPFESAAFAQGKAASVMRVADPFAAFVGEASQRFGIPVSWIRAVMHAESGKDIHALSPKGAMGLMQIMPATWASLRARHGLGANPYDPHDNILAGAAFLRELHDRYGSPGFLAAYNAGPGRYEDHLATGRPLPKETRAYVAAIAPLIGKGPITGAIAIASVPRSRTEGPIFVGQDEGAPGVDDAAASARPNRSPGLRRVVDMSALVPRSDSLFVRISARERPR